MRERVRALRDTFARRDSEVLANQLTIAQIASPTGSESTRAEWMRISFERAGLDSVHIDDTGNVLGMRAGTSPKAPPIIVCSHLDTVFAADTQLVVRQKGERIFVPGIVDNARGLAAMLALASADLSNPHPVLFVATVGEEGLGNLRGAKHLFASFEQVPAACIALDGAGDERIVNRALGSKRFRVDFRGPGGHSWSSAGVANPIHAAARATSRLASISVPRSPETALSVNRIGGGVSVNAIAQDAWLEVDLRSSSSTVLQRITVEIEAAIRSAVLETNAARRAGTPELGANISIIGDRPAGETAESHPLVQAALEATRAIGRTPALALSSTDANVPISLGIPAIAIGAGGIGGATHSTDEWYENTDGTLGLVRAALLLSHAY